MRREVSAGSNILIMSQYVRYMKMAHCFWQLESWGDSSRGVSVTLTNGRSV